MFKLEKSPKIKKKTKFAKLKIHNFKENINIKTSKKLIAFPWNYDMSEEPKRYAHIKLVLLGEWITVSVFSKPKTNNF